jgi:hypothetical protein
LLLSGWAFSLNIQTENKAYERIGICDLSAISVHMRGRYWDPGEEVEEKSTHATLGPFHLVKSEIRLA